MAVTQSRGRQIRDDDVGREDINVTTIGRALIRKIIQGTDISISFTGVDSGTGDVTINLSFASRPANTVLAAPNGSAGIPTFRTLVAADIPELLLDKLPDAWVKRSVRAATTANITLSGTQTVDGIALVAGDRVLVKDQSTPSQNGIYVVAAGAWTRAADADAITELSGAVVAVDAGTTNGGLRFDTDLKITDTLGTTAVTFNRIVDTAYTIPVSQGGTGLTALGTANQLIRVNAGATGLEYFTHNFASTAVGTINTIPKYTSTSGFGNSTISDTGSLVTISNSAFITGTLRLGNSSNYGTLVVGNTAASSDVVASIRNLSPGVAGGLQGARLDFYGDSGYTFGTPTGQIRAISNTDGLPNGNGTLTFSTHNGSSITEGFRLNTFGNLLLGTTTNISGTRLRTVGGVVDFQGTTATDGGQLGTELLTSANWTSTGWTGDFTTGFTHTTGNTTALSNTLAAVVGTYYQITWTVTGRTAGSFTVSFGGYLSGSGTASSAVGPRATTTAGLVITPTSDFNGTIVISIRVITPGSASVVLRNSAGNIVNEIRAFTLTTNTSIGIIASRVITTATNISAYGNSSLLDVTSGSHNSGFGVGTLAGLTIGSGNLGLGVEGGRYINNGSVLTSPFNSIFIGNDTRASADGNTNEIVIGTSGRGNGSNTVTIGNSSTTNNYFTGTINATDSGLFQGRMFAWNTTTPGTALGTVHLGSASATTNAGAAITFSSRVTGTTAQAGIYVNTDGSYGSRMYIATTNSFATGAQTALAILEQGNIEVTRGTLAVLTTSASTSTTTGALRSAGGLGVAGAGWFGSHVNTAGRFISTLANDTATGGGQIFLNGANGNRIDYAAVGVAAPAFTTRSLGTKIVLYPAISASAVDYAIGVENGAMWYSVNLASAGFKWYAGTTNIATLTGTGAVTFTGTLSASISALGTAATTFLTHTSGLVQSRTATQVLSDIGAQATLNGTGYVKMAGTSLSYVAGATSATANTVAERDADGILSASNFRNASYNSTVNFGLNISSLSGIFITLPTTYTGGWARGLEYQTAGTLVTVAGIGMFGGNATPERMYFSFGGAPWSSTGLYILANNDVGIGTPTPVAKLDVRGNGLFMDSNLQHIRIGMESNVGVIRVDWFSGGGGAQREMVLQYGLSDRIRLTSSGITVSAITGTSANFSSAVTAAAGRITGTATTATSLDTGLTKLFVDASGIGGAGLTVIADSIGRGIRVASTTSGGVIGAIDAGTTVNFGSNSAHSVTLRTGGVTALTLDTSQRATFASRVTALGVFIKRTTTGFDGTFDEVIRYMANSDVDVNNNRWSGIDATVTAGAAANNVLRFRVYQGTTAQDQPPLSVLTLRGSGAAEFGGSVSATSFTGGGSGLTSLPSNTALYPTLNQDTSGYAARLLMFDVRTIAPNSHNSGRLSFGFTSWANNNTAPYADYIHLRGYGDASGGNENLITFRKDTIGMRIWQQAFGSATAYSTFVDVLHSGNFSSYALPLTGGTVTSSIVISNAQPVFVLRDNNNSGTGVGQTGWISFQDSTSTERGWVGFGSASSTDFNVSNSRGDVILSPTTGIARVGANTILHAANYSSYALPLTGGSVAGNIALSGGVDRYLQIGSSTNYYWRLKAVNDNFHIVMGNDALIAAVFGYPTGAASFASTITAVNGITVNQAGSDTIYNGAYLSLRQPSDAKQWVQQLSAGWNLDYWYYNASSWSKRMSLSTAGTLTLSGDVVAYGSPSDATLKIIKEKIPNALEGLLKLSGYKFDWKDTNNVLGIKEDIGVIAQEVAEIFPELARTNSDGKMSVRYQGLTAVLIEAIKEQQKQIEELRKLIK